MGFPERRKPSCAELNFDWKTRDVQQFSCLEATRRSEDANLVLRVLEDRGGIYRIF